MRSYQEKFRRNYKLALCGAMKIFMRSYQER